MPVCTRNFIRFPAWFGVIFSLMAILGIFSILNNPKEGENIRWWWASLAKNGIFFIVSVVLLKVSGRENAKTPEHILLAIPLVSLIFFIPLNLKAFTLLLDGAPVSWDSLRTSASYFFASFVYYIFISAQLRRASDVRKFYTANAPASRIYFIAKLEDIAWERLFKGADEAQERRAKEEENS